MQVDIPDAADRLPELVTAARAGEDVVITEFGESVARIASANDAVPSRTERGSPEAILGWIRSHPLPARSRRTAAEIDAAIEEERNAGD